MNNKGLHVGISVLTVSAPVLYLVALDDSKSCTAQPGFGAKRKTLKSAAQRSMPEAAKQGTEEAAATAPTIQ